METDFIKIVQTLVAEQGKAALVDPAKCRAFLPDYAKNEYVKDRRLLQRVVEAGVAKEIDTAANLDICKKQQVRHLKEELFMAEDVAANAVDMLAFVLRGDTGRTVLEAPKPTPQMREASVAAAEPQNLPAPEPVPQKPVTPLPELNPFFENVPQPAPAVTPKPDESKDVPPKRKPSRSEWIENIVFRWLGASPSLAVKTGYTVAIFVVMFILSFLITYMPPILMFLTFLIMMPLFGLFLNAIWKKRE
jgi:hypothetical protein